MLIISQFTVSRKVIAYPKVCQSVDFKGFLNLLVAQLQEWFARQNSSIVYQYVDIANFSCYFIVQLFHLIFVTNIACVSTALALHIFDGLQCFIVAGLKENENPYIFFLSTNTISNNNQIKILAIKK